jgi:ATP-binding cassette, subfamily B, bacterial
VITYKELINFIWQFIKDQKWIFGLIFLIDSFTWSMDALLWPYILSVVIDIFTRFEGDRLAA